MGAQTALDNAGPTVNGVEYANRRWSWFVYVLGFAGEPALYDMQWTHYQSSKWQSSPSDGSTLSYAALPGKTTAVSGFMCASDATSPKRNSQDGPGSTNDQGFHGNYLLCAGSKSFGTTAENSAHHPGGVNVVLADGAVRFVNEQVDGAVWQAAGSRNGAESVHGLE
jgi:prepilin-type processing-associated H-X9-DG protein